MERGYACGVMITASHNPYQDNSFKIKSPTGAAAASILSAVEAAIRANAAGTPPVRPFADARDAGLVSVADPFPGYVTFLSRSLDLERLKAADMRVLVDPLYGSGAGWNPAAVGRRQDPGG